jgi:hypothetical protein
VATPTQEDAQLLVQLAQWGTSLGIQDAMPVLFAPDFDPDTAEVGDEPVRVVLMYGETIGTLVKHSLFDRELANDWIWFSGLWARVAPAALKTRAELGEPKLYENFQALAQPA